MKDRKRAVILAFAAFVMLSVLFSCKGKGSLNVGDTSEASSSVTEAKSLDFGSSSVPESEPFFETDDKAINVSPLASPDFLDFDSSSWERESSPEYIVLHFTSAVVLDRNDPFNLGLVRSIFEENEIGINYIISRDGEILCWLPEDRAAWHAGRGSIEGKPEYTDKMNRYSIGIELLAIGSESDMSVYLKPDEYSLLDPSNIGYTDSQYEAASRLLADICTRYGIECSREYIIGHDEYNPQKTDPGELFDWERLMSMTKELISLSQ